MIKNNKGQGLSEYLILVALIAVSSIGIVRIMGRTMNSQLTNITYALQGNKKEVNTTNIKVDPRLYRKKDMSNFMKDAASDNKN